jgi:hypothetical protein
VPVVVVVVVSVAGLCMTGLHISTVMSSSTFDNSSNVSTLNMWSGRLAMHLISVAAFGL